MKEEHQTDQFNEHLLNSSFQTEKNIRVLKSNETFGIFDRYGDVLKKQEGEQGLYHAGTRFLSKCEFLISGKKPLLLSSFITKDNSTLMVDLTNPDLFDGNLPSSSIYILRSIFLWDMSRYEMLAFYSYLNRSVTFDVTFQFEADYADIFEVRGHKRLKRGMFSQPEASNGGINFKYTGLDRLERYTSIVPTPFPDSFSDTGISYKVTIPPRGSFLTEIKYIIGLHKPIESVGRKFVEGYKIVKDEVGQLRKNDATIVTSNEQFNDLIDRSLADLHLLVTSTKWGPYPYAGVPWFSAPFGRDGIITALELLWMNPNFAKSVLGFLAETQGKTIDEENDCEPGKIIHEARQGEMANLGEIPFKKYYGSVDSTPLFIMLAGAYYKRTDDKEFLERIWPNVKAAINWLYEYGDPDGDGFVEYCRTSTKGLIQQGWKDSENSVFHDNGELADAPIALCEVQGYLYLALKRAADLAKEFGEVDLASHLQRRQEELKINFRRYFWISDLGYIALALDKNKQPCRVKSSNMGHCLFTGIVQDQDAKQIADLLMSPEMFSGWGVRTIGENEALYNPMSYHNGTVWPHDCAIVGAGLARYGFKDYCAQILTGLFDVGTLVDFYRLPELFCGFTRGGGNNPTMYPMSCAPQAWAAGSIFLLLGHCLGIKIKAQKNEVTLYQPHLPPFLDKVTVRNITVSNDASIDLEFTNYNDDVSVGILKKNGPVKLVVIK